MEPQPDIGLHMPYLERIAARCAVILELGCGHGNGSIHAFATGLRCSPASNKLHISVDVAPWQPVIKPEFPWWHKVTGDSTAEMTAIQVETWLDGRAPDLIFIDTDHTYDQLKAELAIWSPLAGPDTLWLFHDTWMGGIYNPMQQALVEFAEAHPEWQFVELTRESHGLGALVNQRSHEYV